MRKLRQEDARRMSGVQTQGFQGIGLTTGYGTHPYLGYPIFWLGNHAAMVAKIDSSLAFTRIE